MAELEELQLEKSARYHSFVDIDELALLPSILQHPRIEIANLSLTQLTSWTQSGLKIIVVSARAQAQYLERAIS